MLALRELKITTAALVIRIAEDVEQPRAGGNQQPGVAAFGCVEERPPPGCPAVRGRHGDPALRLLWFVYVLESLWVPGYPVEDPQAEINVGELTGWDGVGEDPEAAAAQLLDRAERAGDGWPPSHRQARDQQRPEGDGGQSRRQRERIELRLRREINAQRVCAGGLEGRPIGEPLAEVVRLPREHDTDLDRLCAFRMRHADRLQGRCRYAAAELRGAQGDARTAGPRAGRRTMSTLDDWTDAMCAELGLDPKDVNQKTVLNLARVAAHTVDRPAAPLTTYVLGVAVGRGEPLAETAAKLQQLARGWSADHPAD